MLTTFKIIMVLSVVLYIGYIYFLYGMQKSFSDSFYRLPENRKYLFTLFIFSFAYSASVLGANIYITPAALLICGVGVARAFKDNPIMNFTHQLFAYTGILYGMYGVWVYYKMWYITVFFAIGAILLLVFREHTVVKIQSRDEYTHILWFELLAIYCIMFVLIIK